MVYYDTKFSFAGKKSLRPLYDVDCSTLIVDDTESIIHQNTKHQLAVIKRWHGNLKDDELMKALEQIKSNFEMKETGSLLQR